MLISRFESDPRRRAELLTLAILGVGSLVLVAMWLAVGGSLLQARQGAFERARTSGANLSAAFSEEVTHTLDSVSAVMDLVAARIRAEGGHYDIYRWAHEIPQLSTATIQASILDRDGRLVSTTLEPAPEPIDLSDREHFRIHRDGRFKGLFISKPVTGRVSKTVTIQVSKRIEDPAGRFLGVLVFSLLPANLTNLHRIVDLGPRGTLALIGLDDVVRARFSTASPEGLDGIGLSVAGDTRPAAINEGEAGDYVRKSILDGVTRIYAYRRVPNYPLVVTVGLDLDEAFATARRYGIVMLFFAGSATLLLSGLAIFLVRETRTRAQREIELKASTERAEAASRAKSLFLGNMSHELRTPLNAIIGFSQLIKDQAFGPDAISSYADYAKDIHDAGRHLLEMIANILDYSKLESDAVTLNEEPFEIAELVKASVAAIERRSELSGVALTTDIAPDLPPLYGDLFRLRQVLIHLLSNAVKFTPEGGKVALTVARGHAGGIVFAIADTGIGMSPEEVALAFEPFAQVDNALVKRFEGTGVGLPLAKRLVELHRGRLAVESEKGVGTTVRVWLAADRIVVPDQFIEPALTPA